MTDKILFSAGNGPNSIQIIKNFKRLGFEVFIADIDVNAPGSLYSDTFFHLPLIDDEAMMPVLKDIIKKYEIDYFVPVRETECLIASKIREEFTSLNCVLVTPNIKTLETAIDKAYLYDYLSAETDIPMMKYHKVYSLEDLKEGFDKLQGIPLSIKPTKGAGGRGFAIITDKLLDAKTFFTTKTQFNLVTKEDLVKMYELSNNETPPTLLMENLEGVHYDATMLCKDGEVLIQFVKTREEARIGTITKGQVVFHKKIEEINKKIAKSIDATGLIATQFIGDKIIEINPRWSTSLVTEQIDEYLMDLKIWKGQDVDFSSFNYESYLGTRMARYWDMKVYRQDDVAVIECDEKGIRNAKH